MVVRGKQSVLCVCFRVFAACRCVRTITTGLNNFRPNYVTLSRLCHILLKFTILDQSSRLQEEKGVAKWSVRPRVGTLIVPP